MEQMKDKPKKGFIFKLKDRSSDILNYIEKLKVAEKYSDDLYDELIKHEFVYFSGIDMSYLVGDVLSITFPKFKILESFIKLLKRVLSWWVVQYSFFVVEL